MKFKHYLIAGATILAFANFVPWRTTLDTRYDDWTSHGRIKVENIDRHPNYRKDDRRITLKQKWKNTDFEFFDYHGWTGLFMDHDEDYIEERITKRGSLETRTYTLKSYKENGNTFREGSPEFEKSRERLKELTDFFWEISNEAADSIITRAERKAEEDYRIKHKRN